MPDYSNDQLDDILHQAFTHEYATLVDRELVDRVLHSIRLQSRIRLLVLGIALTIGTLICASYVLPVIANMGAWLSPLLGLPDETLMAPFRETLMAPFRETLTALPRETLLGTLTIGLLVVIAPCLFILVDDPI